MDNKDLKERQLLEELHRDLDALATCFSILESNKQGEFELLDTGLDLEHAPTYVKLTQAIKSDLGFIKRMSQSAKHTMRNYRLVLNGYEPLGLLDQQQYDKTKKAVKAGEEFPETLEHIAKHGYFRRESKTESDSQIIKQVLLRMESKLDKLAEEVEQIKLREDRG